MNQDLTVGNPEKVLWKFCIPLFGSIIFQQIYNIADSFVVGKFVGENALAAVGNSYEITLIFLAFAFGCNMGCSVIVSQLFGAKRYGDMKTAVRTALLSSGTLCLLLMLLGVLGSTQILGLIHTPAEVFADSKLYLDIYVWGLPFVFLYNLSTGVFSALGDSKTPFFFLVASSLSNVFVDILFVKSFHMGVAGVAWATFLCQGVSCALALVFIFRRLKTIKVSDKASVFSWSLFRRMAVIAIPSILQQSFISVGNMLIRGLINGFGTGVMAGYSVSIKLNNLVITSFTTLGNGISNYTAQNIGAGKYGRIREGFRAGWKMVWTLSVPIVLLYVLGAPTLVSLFLDQPSAQAMGNGVTILRIFVPFYFVISIKLVADGILRGAGLMRQFMTATFTDLLLRVVLAFLLASTPLGATGIWLAWPVGWSIACGLSVRFYKQAKWE